MMTLKAGVDIRGVQPEVLFAVIAAESLYTEAGYELVITSVKDGKHSANSLHYKGHAIDLRTVTAGMPADLIRRIASRLRAALGAQFDVVVESDHIHVEFDPKENKR